VGLVLAGPDSGDNPNCWTQAFWKLKNGSMQLVVLSACETESADVNPMMQRMIGNSVVASGRAARDWQSLECRFVWNGISNGSSSSFRFSQERT